MLARLRTFRVSPRTFRRWVLLTIGVFVLITVTGAGVRLTGSGLGCEDWPTCNDDRFVAELDDVHSLIEFGNRLISGLVLIPVVACVVAAHHRDPRRSDLIRLSWAVLGVLAIEIPLGGITVLMGLTPLIVGLHFLVSILLIGMAVVLLDRADGGEGPAVAVVGRGIRAWSRGAVTVASVVIVTGTLVTGAGPHSGDEDVGRLPIEITDIVRIHSLAMWALLAVSTFVLWSAYRAGLGSRGRRRGGQLVAAIVVQGAIGYAQYALGVPAWLVILHIAGSTAVWITLLRFHLSLTSRTDETAPAPLAVTPEAVVAR